VAVAIRSAAGLHSPRWMMSSSGAGMSIHGATSANRGGVRLTCAPSIASGSLSSNGARPTSIS